MGVQDLWSIVEPVRESVPLYSLSGKTLAVDLSLWVCEAQHVQAMMGRVTKPHLRNLFFRVSSLTLMGVKLVFVMEGEAPKLKAETMSKRTQTRYGGFKKGSAPKCNVNTSRGRFNAILRECAEMLDFLGVPWVTAAGEAEAMCAFLDSQGVVDGCITNDGDAFLYGARTVYRNFNLNSKDPQVDCYRTSRVQTELQLSRENLVGLAIFLGCDYIPKGIAGVGKEHAMRLIQMLRGTTLLQRFSQWKEQNATASAVIVKKVPHCQVCRHPGSAKAHERGGCVFCESKHFCQPQDFDYQCPCEWHLSEHTRQALSFEANIKKKTLASEHFPFTEIIQEFLTSKDKPVSHFKRRQPNLLLMQKFAYDKMEWPKHYTSEKVLVLMTYAELMNKKCGREMGSQIKPIRILKPRVRNAISCFEVIWSTPDHYVFPDDQLTQDQNEVRTVEEESLVRVAYPELVESFMRDKARAEENKANKKKSKKKKEKTPDPVSDGISDLLAQMNLKCSSMAPTSKTLGTISNKDDPVLIILDTPENRKREQKSDKDHGSLSDGLGTPRSRADSAASASPSLSSVIEALHLSDIDWDAQSFTSSPLSAANHVTEPRPSKMAASEVNETKRLEVKTPSDIREADYDLSAELSYTECPLRDRVLMRNTARAVDQMEVHNKGVLKLQHCELAPQSSDSNSALSGHLHGKRDTDGNAAGHFKDVLTDKGQNATNKTKAKQQFRFKAKPPSRTKDMYDGSHKPRQKSASVQTATSCSAVTQQRHHSEPGQSRKTGSQTTKKSVCLNVISSSEDSDGENHFCRQSKTRNRIKDYFPQTTKVLTKMAQPDQLAPLKPQSCSVDTRTNSTPALPKARCQPISPATEIDDVFLHNPPSPVSVLDSDSSVNCGDSPLPLAERLKLKFLQ